MKCYSLASSEDTVLVPAIDFESSDGARKIPARAYGRPRAVRERVFEDIGSDRIIRQRHRARCHQHFLLALCGKWCQLWKISGPRERRKHTPAYATVVTSPRMPLPR